MSIHDLSVRCASYLARELGSDHRQEQRMAYGLEIILGEVNKLVILLLLAWLLGILPEILVLSFTASILRLASGGEHCSEYYRCLIGSTTCFLLLGLLIHWVSPGLEPLHFYLIAGLAFLPSLALLGKYAPGDTENKPINNEDERRNLKRLSIIIVTLYLVIMMTLVGWLHLYSLALAIAVGMLEQVFTVTPAGYRFMHGVDRMLDFSRGRKSNEPEDSHC